LRTRRESARWSVIGSVRSIFSDCATKLRERLLPREPLPARSIATEPAILDAGERSVLVHVRRTDYVGNPYHGVLPMEYYREAAALIAAKGARPGILCFLG